MERSGAVMAVTGLQTQPQSGVRVGAQDVATWREATKMAFKWAFAAGGAALIVVIPPQFDFSVTTMLSVAIVGAFLVLMERPQESYQGFQAPMTAILAASVIAVGWWALPISLLGWTAAHLRLGKSLFRTSSLACQLGIATFAIYAMIGVFRLVTLGLPHVPSYITQLAFFLGVVAVGITWQTVNNALVSAVTAIDGQRVSLIKYWRAGLIAALWSYLLAGMYAFGGIFAAAVFYIVVAQTRMFHRIFAIVEEADERDLVATQFKELMRQVMRFSDTSDVEFGAEVKYLATRMASKLNLPRRDVELVGMAAQLHEIGKCMLEPAVRAGAHLTEAQTYLRARYPMLGAQLLRKSSKLVPEPVAYAVEHQNECFDGSGYPHGIRSTRIPLESRIVAIARDYLATLTGHDGVRQLGKQDALALLRERAGKTYDPALVDLLCDGGV